MDYKEVLENARKNMSPKCRVCPECNGLACKGELPGAGGKGEGRSFTVCREFFKSIKVNMDCVHENYEPDTKISLFGKTFDMPFFIAPIGGMGLNYTGYLTEKEYNLDCVLGMREMNSLAFTGDGPQKSYFEDTLEAIEKAGGMAVSTIKPWEHDVFMEKVKKIEALGGIAIASDLDSAGLINLRLMGTPVNPRSLEDLKKICSETKLPFLAKGIMTAKSALKCKEAGCYGVIVSSHGGRIMEDNPCPASMVEEIREACGKGFKIIVDGGIRSGEDVFKCIALGADAVLIGRPYVIAAHGGRKEGIKLYTQKILSELKEVMIMTDCKNLSEITREKIKF